jgi:hypothetical protein
VSLCHFRMAPNRLTSSFCSGQLLRIRQQLALDVRDGQPTTLVTFCGMSITMLFALERQRNRALSFPHGLKGLTSSTTSILLPKLIWDLPCHPGRVTRSPSIVWRMISATPRSMTMSYLRRLLCRFSKISTTTRGCRRNPIRPVFLYPVTSITNFVFAKWSFVGSCILATTGPMSDIARPQEAHRLCDHPYRKLTFRSQAFRWISIMLRKGPTRGQLRHCASGIFESTTMCQRRRFARWSRWMNRDRVNILGRRVAAPCD